MLPEYEATVGSFLKILRGLEGRAEGDPRKIVNVILQLANSDEVPVRLILGVDAEVDAVDMANGRVTVMINIFGRSTPVELEYWQIEAL